MNDCVLGIGLMEVMFLFALILLRWFGFRLIQVRECNCCGEHRKGVAGSHLPKDTCGFWFWNLRVL